VTAAGCDDRKEEIMMAQRMNNPAMLVPEAMETIGKLNQAARNGAAPDTLRDLVHLRASQIKRLQLLRRRRSTARQAGRRK